MKLSDYRAAKKLTTIEMGRLLGVSHSTISRLESHKVAPSRGLVEAIVKVTAGEVTPNDLFDTRADIALAEKPAGCTQDAAA